MSMIKEEHKTEENATSSDYNHELENFSSHYKLSL
jgi:hypothetical protein